MVKQGGQNHPNSQWIHSLSDAQPLMKPLTYQLSSGSDWLATEMNIGPDTLFGHPRTHVFVTDRRIISHPKILPSWTP